MLNLVGSLIVYHVTPEENIASIWMKGICPSYARGKMGASWYISKHRIEWALIHTSVAHHVGIDELAVCAVHVDAVDLYKFFKPGYYYSFTTLQIESATPAMFFLHNYGMDDDERFETGTR